MYIQATQRGAQTQETHCRLLSLPLMPRFVVESILLWESDGPDCSASLYHLVGLWPSAIYLSSLDISFPK